MNDDTFDCLNEPAGVAEGEAPRDALADELREIMEKFHEVERIAGMPRGTIASKFLRKVVNEWCEGEPGSLSRWMDEHFAFEGDPEELAAIRRALFRAEAHWREEEAGALRMQLDALGCPPISPPPGPAPYLQG